MLSKEKVDDDDLAEVGQVLEMCRSLLSDIVRRAPGVRAFVDDQAFILNEINPALVKLQRGAARSATLLSEAIAEYKEDAERYRWLRDRPLSNLRISSVQGSDENLEYVIGTPMLDTAIDAARKSESEHGN